MGEKPDLSLHISVDSTQVETASTVLQRPVIYTLTVTSLVKRGFHSCLFRVLGVFLIKRSL